MNDTILNESNLRKELEAIASLSELWKNEQTEFDNFVETLLQEELRT